jgi:Integrase core domain/Nucleotidyltransferase domain
MSCRTSGDPILAEIVRRLIEALQPERIYLFGSRARGEAGADSDYDLMVVVPHLAEPAYWLAQWAHAGCGGWERQRTSSCGRGRRLTAGFTSRPRCPRLSSGRANCSIPHDATRAADTRGWLRKAADDLRGAEVDLAALPSATRLNQRWTMDFIEDRLVTGRKFRTFNVMDAFSRRGPGQRSGYLIARLLGRPGSRSSGEEPRRPRGARPGPTAEALRLHFIAPGKPIQNAKIESFHGRFRDECLNEASAAISTWTTPRSGRRPAWPRAWSRRRCRGPS